MIDGTVAGRGLTTEPTTVDGVGDALGATRTRGIQVGADAGVAVPFGIRAREATYSYGSARGRDEEGEGERESGKGGESRHVERRRRMRRWGLKRREEVVECLERRRGGAGRYGGLGS